MFITKLIFLECDCFSQGESAGDVWGCFFGVGFLFCFILVFAVSLISWWFLGCVKDEKKFKGRT